MASCQEPIAGSEITVSAKGLMIAAAVIVMITLPGVIYWNISDDFSTTYVYSVTTFTDGTTSAAEYSCEDVSYERAVTSCYDQTEVEAHTTGERVTRGVMSSLLTGLIVLIFVVIWADKRPGRRDQDQYI